MTRKKKGYPIRSMGTTSKASNKRYKFKSTWALKSVRVPRSGDLKDGHNVLGPMTTCWSSSSSFARGQARSSLGTRLAIQVVRWSVPECLVSQEGPSWRQNKGNSLDLGVSRITHMLLINRMSAPGIAVIFTRWWGRVGGLE